MNLRLPADLLPVLNGKTVYCGFSGGADSQTLLLLLHESEKEFCFSLQAVHFEHGLRGREGEEDALFCRKFCDKRKIPFTQISLDVPKNIQPGEGVEAAARRIRMEYWKKLPGNALVALGHNADDRIENLFLRLMRGSNVSALTSLAEYNETEGVAIIRPLLSFSRKQITDYLKGRGLEWRTDSTNLESDYGRNFLRNKILPELYSKFPYAGEGIRRALLNLQADAMFIDHSADELYPALDLRKVQTWKSLPDAIFCRVLRKFLSNKIGKNVIAGHQLIERFKHELSIQRGQGYAELVITSHPEYSLFIGDIEVYLIKKEEIPTSFWNPLDVPQFTTADFTLNSHTDFPGKGDGTFFAVFDQRSLKFPLLVRNVRSEDKMIPFGKRSPVSIKKLLSDASIPAPLRLNYPVICDNTGEILWIPGVKRSPLAPAHDSENIGISFHSHFC